MDGAARGLAAVAKAQSAPNAVRASMHAPMATGMKVGALGGAGAVLSNGTDTSTTYRTMIKTPNFAISDLQFAFPNWYLNSGSGEADTPNSITIKASLEYNGATYPIWFDGARNTVVEAGANRVSDALGLQIPASSTIYVKVYVSVTAGQKWPTGRTLKGGVDGFWTGSDTTDTPGTTSMSSTFAAIYGPSVMFGIPETYASSVFIVGDSIAAGSGETSAGDVNACQGFIERALSNNLPWISSTRASATVNDFNAKNTRRLAYGPQFCTHAICELGTNDFSGGGYTLAQMQAMLQTEWSNLAKRGLKVWQTTFVPRVTSTDSYATLANQTPVTGEAIRVQLNDWIRTTPAPLTGYFEIADIAESSRNSGFWKVTGAANYATADGTHPTPAMHILMAAGIDLTRLT